MSQYPRTVAEVVGEVEYPEGVLHALKEYRKSKPWSGDSVERREKLTRLHSDLNRATGLKTALRFRDLNGQGLLYPTRNEIHVDNTPSVLTYLHEYGHALLGESEYEACRWSINLFRLIFPKSYNRLRPQGYTLVRR